MEGPSRIARSAQDRTCLAAHQQHQLLLPVQTASLLHVNGSGASRQCQRRSHELRVVAVQTVQRLQAPEGNHDAAMLNQHRREGDYEAGLVQLQVLLQLTIQKLKGCSHLPPVAALSGSNYMIYSRSRPHRKCELACNKLL